MKIQNLYPVAAFVLVLAACHPSAPDAQVSKAPAPNPPAAAKHQPTAERALERSRARWAAVVKPDWITAYDFQAPEMKRALPIATYLVGVAVHKFENPRVIEVLRIEKDDAYVHCKVQWTPQPTPEHPEIGKVKLKPGESMTQDVDQVETWRWAEGDWTYHHADGLDEFYQKHPDLLKQDGGGTPSPAPNAPKDGTPPPK